MVDQIRIAERDPEHALRVAATLCSTNAGIRPSSKEAANSSIRPIARSVTPRNRAAVGIAVSDTVPRPNLVQVAQPFLVAPRARAVSAAILALVGAA